MPLHEPLQDHVDILSRGEIDLADNSSSKNDILQQLPSIPSITPLPGYTLPAEAIKLINSSFMNKEVSGIIEYILVDPYGCRKASP